MPQTSLTRQWPLLARDQADRGHPRHGARRPSGIALAVVVVVALAAGTVLGVRAAESPAANSDGAGPFDLAIAPGAIDEQCIKLARGQSIHYNFTANAALEFNLHWHQGNKVVYPFKRAATRGEDHAFTAPVAQKYCLMWQNRGAAEAHVKGRIDRAR